MDFPFSREISDIFAHAKGNGVVMVQTDEWLIIDSIEHLPGQTAPEEGTSTYRIEVGGVVIIYRVIPAAGASDSQ